MENQLRELNLKLGKQKSMYNIDESQLLLNTEPIDNIFC